MNNIKDVNEGDHIKGSWLDEVTGKTYFSEGTVRRFPAGLFVQEGKDGGVTPLKDFFHISSVNGQDYNNSDNN